MTHDGSMGHAMFSMSNLVLFYSLIENPLTHFEILKVSRNFNVLEMVFETNCFVCGFFNATFLRFRDTSNAYSFKMCLCYRSTQHATKIFPNIFDSRLTNTCPGACLRICKMFMIFVQPLTRICNRNGCCIRILSNFQASSEPLPDPSVCQ